MATLVAEHRDVRTIAGGRNGPARGVYGPLWRVGGITAAVAAVLTPVSVAILTISKPPAYDEGAAVWFEHIQDNVFLGLMNLDLPFLAVTVLMIPVMLALFVTLRDARPASMTIAAVLYLVAVATYFGTNTSFEMVSLSDRYIEAATETQRVALLGAGDAMLAAFTGTAFHINYVLAQVAGIIFGVTMLRTQTFGRPVAYLMIGGNAFGFLLYVPAIGIALSALSGLILWIWMILVSRRLLQLAGQEHARAGQRSQL